MVLAPICYRVEVFLARADLLSALDLRPFTKLFHLIILWARVGSCPLPGEGFLRSVRSQAAVLADLF